MPGDTVIVRLFSDTPDTEGRVVWYTPPPVLARFFK
jgi:hypothetical protein